MSALLRVLESGCRVILRPSEDGYAVAVEVVDVRGREHHRAVSTVGDFEKQLEQAMLSVAQEV